MNFFKERQQRGARSQKLQILKRRCLWTAPRLEFVFFSLSPLWRRLNRNENWTRRPLCVSRVVMFFGWLNLANILRKAGGHCVLKWGFTQTFPGNQDATLKLTSEIIFIKSVFLKPLSTTSKSISHTFLSMY